MFENDISMTQRC